MERKTYLKPLIATMEVEMETLLAGSPDYELNLGDLAEGETDADGLAAKRHDTSLWAEEYEEW